VRLQNDIGDFLLILGAEFKDIRTAIASMAFVGLEPIPTLSLISEQLLISPKSNALRDCFRM